MNFLVFSLIIFFYAINIHAKDGAELFRSLECANCHAPGKDQTNKGLGSSMQTIKKHYSGNLPGLIKFLEGNEEPLIYPHRFELMKQQQKAISNLSNEERIALAKYILK